ncbi:hypothetical protein EC968_005421 [Mortierella alpina]|nr:hypothetical protein EC968_005421 [Mortierella alpina]
MAKVAKHARPTSLKNATPASAARTGGSSAAASRQQEIARTASSLPVPASTSSSSSSKSIQSTHPRLLNQSRFLPPAKQYPKDYLKASPKATRIQRTTPGLPSFNVRSTPSPKSAKRPQPSPLNRSDATMTSFRKTDRTPVHTRYSISDLEMNTPISVSSDDSSDDMPGKSGLDSENTSKKVQTSLESSGSIMEPIQTFLRLRPPHPAAADQEERSSYVDILNSTDVLMTPPPGARAKFPSKYTFTKVFDPAATQSDVFKDTCAPLLTPLLKEDNYNAVLFAYGVSASGKTHSIIGSNIPDQAGILPRALAVLFKSIEATTTDSGEASQYRPVGYRDVEKVDPAGLGQSTTFEKNRRNQIKTFRRMARQYSKTPGLGGHTAGFEIPTHGGSVDYDGDAISLPKGMDYTVWISCAELYTEKIYDLLGDPPPGTQSLLLSAMGTKRQELYLKKDSSTGHKYIDNLKEVQVRTLEEALLVLSAGLGQRQVYSKLLNKYSSRSHCIFTIKVLKTPQFGGSATEDAAKGKTSVGRLSIVDLAGPERFQGSQNMGQRQKEAGNINTSLMVLGHCMQVLRLNQTKSSKIPQSVPFRHSILTQLFQCALEGKSASTRVTLLINSDPHANAFDETTQALRFASTVLDVSTDPNNMKQSFEEVISDLHGKISAMERERENMDEEIKAAVIEQVKNEVLGEMADRLHRERIMTASAATQTPTAAPMDIATQTPTSTFADAGQQTCTPVAVEMAVQTSVMTSDMASQTPISTYVDIGQLTCPMETADMASQTPTSICIDFGQQTCSMETADMASQTHTSTYIDVDQQTCSAETFDMASQTTTTRVVDTLSQIPTSALADIRRPVSTLPVTDMTSQPPVAALTNRVPFRECSPIPCQDGSDERHADLDLASEVKRLKRLLEEANQRNAAWQSWHSSAPCFAPLRTPPTAALPVYISNRTTLDLEEEAANSEDRLCVAVYESHSAPTVSPEEECEAPIALEEHNCSVPDVRYLDITAEMNSSEKDELIDEEYHSGPDEETASLSPSSPPSPRQSLSASQQCVGVVVDMATEPFAHRESSPASDSSVVLEDSNVQESSAVPMPFLPRNIEAAVTFKDVSPADEPEPRALTPDEELDLENGTPPRRSPSCHSYWEHNPFNPQEVAKHINDDEEYGSVKAHEVVEEYEAYEAYEVYETIEEHANVKDYECVKEYEDAKKDEDAKNDEDVEKFDDAKEYDDIERYEDVKEYQDVSPAEEPLPETFALGASSPRSRSGSPYWDASSLSPQAIVEDFEEPEPGPSILPPDASPPQTPPRQTPPRRSPLASPLWKTASFDFQVHEQGSSEADAEQVSTQASVQEEGWQPDAVPDTVSATAEVAPLTPKRKRKLRQKNAVFEEEMGESVGLPPPETMTRRKRTRRWD